MKSAPYIAMVAIAILALIGGGCSAPQVRELSGNAKTISPANSGRIKDLLYEQHREWRGVIYREGGLSKKGVDCSGFVYLTFRSKLGRTIPRTTARLIDTGTKISRDQLRPGDLVFFKTGIKKRHVGVYVENSRFLHASTSKGVILSRLDNVYWDEAFWQARRL